MSHPLPIRWALTALLFLISASFVQTTIIDIPYTDERVLVTPKTDWYVIDSCEFRRIPFIRFQVLLEL